MPLTKMDVAAVMMRPLNDHMPPDINRCFKEIVFTEYLEGRIYYSFEMARVSHCYFTGLLKLYEYV